jgi:MFS family permease
MGTSSETLRSAVPATRVRYLVLTWLCLAAVIAYMPRNSIGPAEKTISSDLGLRDLDIFGVTLTPHDQMGQVMGSFFLTYAIFQIPAGRLAHVWGTRRALTLFAILWSILAGLGALAQDYVWLMISRLGMGAAQAGIFTCATLSVARWFPATHRAVASGALGSCMSIGSALAALFTGLLLKQETSWRTILLLFSLPGIAWAVWFFMWFRDRPEDHAAVNQAERDLLAAPASANGATGVAQSAQSEAVPWRRILASPSMWWICGQQLFRAAGYMFYATWFATYLQETRTVPEWLSGVLASLPMFGVVLGCLIGGIVSDAIVTRTGSRSLGRKGLAIATHAACALLILLAIPINDPVLAVLVISVGSFCSSVGGPCAYAITIDVGGKHVATVFSMMNMAGNIGAMLFPLVVPVLLRWMSWDGVLYVFAGIYLAGALCWTAIDANRTIYSPSPER